MSENKNVKTRQVVTAHPSSLKHSNSNNTVKSGFWAKVFPHWPISLSILLSISWVSFCIYLGLNADISTSSLSLMELSSIVSGATLPLVMLWVLCLIIIRINPIAENYRSLETGLDQLLNPVELTQERITKVINNLKSEIEKIEVAGDMAAARFLDLEKSYNKQTKSLFEATKNADEKSTSMKEKLSSERDAISLLAYDIEKHSEKITEQLQKVKEDANRATVDSKKHSEHLNNEMNTQNEILTTRATEIEEKLASLATRLSEITDDISDKSTHSHSQLNEVIDSFDQRRAQLGNFLTTMKDEVGSICKELDQQTKTVDKITSTSSKTSEKITKSIKKQAQELSKVAEKAVKDVNNSSQAIEDQTENMGKKIEEATELSKINIAKASDYFNEAANDMNRISSDLEGNIKQNFNEITDTITDKATLLGDDINIQFQNIEADLERGNSSISDIISANAENIEIFMGEILGALEAQSEHIEKSLNDSRVNLIDRTAHIQEEHQSLEKYADAFQTRMLEAENEFKNQNKNMQSCIAVIETGITVAIEKIKKNSTSLGSHGQKVIESIISQTSELTNQIAEIQNRSKNSIVEIQNASVQASNNILKKERTTTAIIEEWLTKANNVGVEHSENMRKIESLISELIAIEKSTSKSISTSEEKIKRISNDLLHSSDRIHIASNSAIEAVAETNKALDKNAEKYQQMINAIQLSSQSLASNANAIESRFKRINSDKFSEVSAKIMQKLQSGSIDIIKYLDGEVPKDLWDKYISGDKNVFIRKIKKHIGKKAITDIRVRYRDDQEFRINVDSFLQVFEELLATFSDTTDTVYTETLITSDIGKVYFALSEATGRLNS